MRWFYVWLGNVSVLIFIGVCVIGFLFLLKRDLERAKRERERF